MILRLQICELLECLKTQSNILHLLSPYCLPTVSLLSPYCLPTVSLSAVGVPPAATLPRVLMIGVDLADAIFNIGLWFTEIKTINPAVRTAMKVWYYWKWIAVTRLTCQIFDKWNIPQPWRRYTMVFLWLHYETENVTYYSSHVLITCTNHLLISRYLKST